MHKPRPPRLPPILQAEIDQCPLPVEIVPGKRHWRVVIDGVQVLVLSHGNNMRGDYRSAENGRSAIRRFVRSRS